MAQTREKPRRGRPVKSKSTTEQKAPKLTKEEKQAIKLERQKAREAAKAGTEPANKDRFYCTNKELVAELVKWRDSNKTEEDKLYAKWCKTHTTTASKRAEPFTIDYTRRKISDELANMLLAIGNKLLNHSNFRNYTKELKDDMLMFGIEKIIKGLKNYNFQFNNAFAYCTQSFWNAYLTIIAKHYKQQNIKKDLMLKLSQELETYAGISANSALNKCIKSYLGNDVELD